MYENVGVDRGARRHEHRHMREAVLVDPATLKRLYVEEQLSTLDVAVKLGCSGATILRRLRQSGIDIRRRGPASRDLRDSTPIQPRDRLRMRAHGDGRQSVRAQRANVIRLKRRRPGRGSSALPPAARPYLSSSELQGISPQGPVERSASLRLVRRRRAHACQEPHYRTTRYP